MANKSGALLLVCLILFSSVLLPAVNAGEDCKSCYNACLFNGDCSNEQGSEGTVCDQLCEFNCRGPELLCNVRNFFDGIFGGQSEDNKPEEKKV